MLLDSLSMQKVAELSRSGAHNGKGEFDRTPKVLKCLRLNFPPLHMFHHEAILTLVASHDFFFFCECNTKRKEGVYLSSPFPSSHCFTASLPLFFLFIIISFLSLTQSCLSESPPPLCSLLLSLALSPLLSDFLYLLPTDSGETPKHTRS